NMGKEKLLECLRSYLWDKKQVGIKCCSSQEANMTERQPFCIWIPSKNQNDDDVRMR
uniref:Uncharacterized protein n=1 Tax=Cynoglossus semilaevis TaxID=244447 RepID=A0A3P8VEV6_CYNSE